MSKVDIETVFDCLLLAALEQTATLEERIRDPARSRALGTCLRRTIDRLDRVAVLSVVRAPAGWNVVPQRSIAAKLDALHGRADPLLARLRLDGEIGARRFATHLAGLDPLAPFRSGPSATVDVSEKVITGVAMLDALRYRAEDGGPIAPPAALIAAVTLRDADLRLAQLSMARLLDLDARGASLDGAVAIEARLSRVNLAGASMQGANLQAVLARDCDFADANLAYARWHGGTAVRCSFDGAELWDLSADRAVFLDCNLQGADLAVGNLGARVTMEGAQFLRCDLRWSRWENRTLAGVRFVDCKLYGVLGVPHFDGVIIDRPDLSVDGDGSWTGSLEDVLALWRGAPIGAMPLGPTLRAEAS
jgi:uncharacterized protein YjbI with pentapeptide repeats